MPTPTIPDGKLFFNALTYAGSASNQTISGLSFQPDFIWFKERTTGGIDHNLFDSARSNYGSRLISNSGSAEAASSAIVSVSSTGYTLLGGVSNTNDAFGRTYVTWNWKAGGAAVTNTTGTVSAQVSANPTAGFSIATFTAPASGQFTIGHGLGVAPAFVTVKNLVTASTSWWTYHSALGINNTDYVVLDRTDAEASFSTMWGASGMTSSTCGFTVGGAVNASVSHVAYIWAPIAGYSAFGSYTGNGSTDGPFVYLGFRPRFIIVKASSTAGYNWILFDSTRSPTNVASAELYPNLANAEGTDSSFDFLSNGFKLRVTSGNKNLSGTTYIYMAFAENPFKYANAR
jgi:hypothetical protein